jgi:hypothetical protein
MHVPWFGALVISNRAEILAARLRIPGTPKPCNSPPDTNPIPSSTMLNLTVFFP